MPALNFRKEFAPLVLDGTKRQTVRNYRKDGRDPKVGDTLYLYTGMRTKSCQKLGEAICTKVADVAITTAFIDLDGHRLSSFDHLRFAQADGFSSVHTFNQFFIEDNPDVFVFFQGKTIYWDSIVRGAK